MRYSLIVATLNDAGKLARLLESLCQLERGPSFEVIIVDQNQDDRVIDQIGRFWQRLDILYLRVTFVGASRSRNFGAQKATGLWLAFPDDDCQFFPDTLVEVDRAREDSQVFVVTGRTVDEQGNPSVLRWKLEPTEFTAWNMFGCLTESTLFVDKKSFHDAGAFDERFGPGASYQAAEGVDLMDRLFSVRPGCKACYSPKIRIKHPAKIPPWNSWAVDRFFSYARGDGALIAKTLNTHCLWWGFRTFVSAFLQIISFRGWISIAYAARVIGLIDGFLSFRLSLWRF